MKGKKKVIIGIIAAVTTILRFITIREVYMLLKWKAVWLS